MHHVDAAYRYNVTHSVVWVLGTQERHTRTAELSECETEMTLASGSVGPQNHVVTVAPPAEYDRKIHTKWQCDTQITLITC